MVDSRSPAERDLGYRATVAYKEHQAKPLIPPMPELDFSKMPAGVKQTPENKRLWTWEAERFWESRHIAAGFRRY